MLTELIFILDRSGSMSGLEADTIGGFNGLIEKQKADSGKAKVTTVLFDDRYELLHDRVNIRDMKMITNQDYFVRGSTALLDAIGITINKMITLQKNAPREEQATKVMFVITTDGMENASLEYNYEKIRQLISVQKEKYNWEFIFLGANIDAIKSAEKFGISANRASNYHADSQGTALNYDVISEAITSVRSNQAISESWKEEIEFDFKMRTK